MITIFPCDSRRSKGVLSGSGVFLRLLVGELGTPKLAQIFAYGKWLYPYTAHQIWTKDVWKRVILRTDIFSAFEERSLYFSGFKIWKKMTFGPTNLFVISLPRVQTRVFRASPQFFSSNDVDRRSLHSTWFPTNVFAPTPKIPQNPIWGTFQCKPVIERALCKSHVNGMVILV